MYDRLFITGFMGAGKTCVGELLAKRLGLNFLDTDRMIEARAGMSIRDIFQNFGEEVFRKMEQDLCRSLPGKSVVALGGGTFIQSDIKELLQATGLTLFLDWPFQVLAKRILNDPARPLATSQEELAMRFHDRIPFYREAKLCWKSQPPHQETPHEIVRAILLLLQARNLQIG